jgi:hypothetical protein
MQLFKKILEKNWKEETETVPKRKNVLISVPKKSSPCHLRYRTIIQNIIALALPSEVLEATNMTTTTTMELFLRQPDHNHGYRALP